MLRASCPVIHTALRGPFGARDLAPAPAHIYAILQSQPDVVANSTFRDCPLPNCICVPTSRYISVAYSTTLQLTLSSSSHDREHSQTQLRPLPSHQHTHAHNHHHQQLHLYHSQHSSFQAGASLRRPSTYRCAGICTFVTRLLFFCEK